ncbi:MAG: CRTAC1 family protein [Terriglobales bacterium]
MKILLPGDLLAVLASGIIGFGLGTSMTLGAIAQTAGPSGPLAAVEKAPKFLRRFVDVTRTANIDFHLTAGSAEKRYIFESVEGGVAVFDFDNDGWPDIYFVNGTTMELGNGPRAPVGKLYRNRHDGSFEDVTLHSGISVAGWCFGAAVGDYDNDGFDDLFISCLQGNHLYHNNRNGTFTDVTDRAGVRGAGFSTSAAFGDYDNDGYLDLVVARYVDVDPAHPPAFGKGSFCSYRGLPVYCGPRGLTGQRDLLYHNNKDGTFTEVGVQLGIDPKQYYGLGVIWGDYDNDGRLDLYVANDSTASLLYHNVTPPGGSARFEEVALPAGVAYSPDGHEQAGMGVDFGDYDADGWMDLIKTNFSDDAPNVYHNNRDGTFTDLTFESGLGEVSRTSLGFGIAFADLDNSGVLDIVVANGHVNPQVDRQPMGISYAERNFLFRNLGNGRFLESGRAAGPGFSGSAVNRGLALIDFDNDGFLDLIFTRLDASPALLHNVSADGESTQHHWLAMKLEGTRSNRDGFGARVKVTQDGVAQIREVRSNFSYLSASDPRPHFGFGSNAHPVDIQVHWPSGTVDNLRNIAVDRFILLKEGSSPIPPRKEAGDTSHNPVIRLGGRPESQ